MVAKNNVTVLDIILEAIRYIVSLQDELASKILKGEIIFVEDFRLFGAVPMTLTE